MKCVFILGLQGTNLILKKKKKTYIKREKTKLQNSKKNYKEKEKTHKYINRQNQSTTRKL